MKQSEWSREIRQEDTVSAIYSTAANWTENNFECIAQLLLFLISYGQQFYCPQLSLPLSNIRVDLLHIDWHRALLHFFSSLGPHCFCLLSRCGKKDRAERKFAPAHTKRNCNLAHGLIQVYRLRLMNDDAALLPLWFAAGCRITRCTPNTHIIGREYIRIIGQMSLTTTN